MSIDLLKHADPQKWHVTDNVFCNSAIFKIALRCSHCGGRCKKLLNASWAETSTIFEVKPFGPLAVQVAKWRKLYAAVRRHPALAAAGFGDNFQVVSPCCYQGWVSAMLDLLAWHWAWMIVLSVLRVAEKGVLLPSVMHWYWIYAVLVGLEDRWTKRFSCWMYKIFVLHGGSVSYCSKVNNLSRCI